MLSSIPATGHQQGHYSGCKTSGISQGARFLRLGETKVGLPFVLGPCPAPETCEICIPAHAMAMPSSATDNRNRSFQARFLDISHARSAICLAWQDCRICMTVCLHGAANSPPVRDVRSTRSCAPFVRGLATEAIAHSPDRCALAAGKPRVPQTPGAPNPGCWTGQSVVALLKLHFLTIPFLIELTLVAQLSALHLHMPDICLC